MELSIAELFLLGWALIATALAVKFHYDFMRVIRTSNEMMEVSIHTFKGVADGKLDIVRTEDGVKVIKKGATE